MCPQLHPLACGFVATGVLLASTGCVSSKYKLAEYEKQAVPMNIDLTPLGRLHLKPTARCPHRAGWRGKPEPKGSGFNT